MQTFSASFAVCSSYPLRRRRISTSPPRKPNLRRLTSRVVQLTRRRQLHQIMEEIEVAKERFGKLNTVVMNAVVEACVHCGDIDSALMLFDEMAEPGSCGVDTITYGTILKGLGVARRIDDAFYVLESVERGTAVGSPKLSAPLVLGLLNVLVEAGDLRRSNGLLHHYGFLLREGGSLTVRVYNLLMKVLLSRRSSSKLISLSSLLLEVVRVYNALLLISFLSMLQNVQLPLKQQGKLL